VLGDADSFRLTKEILEERYGEERVCESRSVPGIALSPISVKHSRVPSTLIRILGFGPEALSLKITYLACSFLILIGIVLWQGASFGVFGSGFMLGWDSPNYIALANVLSKYGIAQSTSTWGYPHLYTQILAGVAYLSGNITLTERTLPLFFAFLSVYGGFLLALGISRNIHVAGLSSILQASSISFLKIFSDNNRNLMAISLAFIVMLILQRTWTRPPKWREYLSLLALTGAIAATQFETFAVLSATLVVSALLTRKRQNIVTALTIAAIPSAIMLALFPEFFLTYFQMPIQTPNQSLGPSQLLYWVGGSVLMLVLIVGGCVYSLMEWRKRGSLLGLLVLVWSTILLAIFAVIYSGVLSVQAEFGIRALLLVPSYLLIPLGALLVKDSALWLLRNRTTPLLGISKRQLAAGLTAVLLLVVLVMNFAFALPQSSLYINPFIQTSTYNKITLASNYVKDDNLGVPIIVFEGSYGYAELYRSYFGALLGENFAYYGNLSNLLQLTTTQSNSTEPYQHFWENYLSKEYLQEMIGNASGPAEYVHQSHVTSPTSVMSHTLILITPDLYNAPIPRSLTASYNDSGVYVIRPGVIASLNREVGSSYVRVSRNGTLATHPATVTTPTNTYPPVLDYVGIATVAGISLLLFALVEFYRRKDIEKQRVDDSLAS
jgi:hypothetical protein